MFLRGWCAPLNAFTTPDPESKEGERHTLDLKKTLESRGIPFPAGSDAVYDTLAQCLIVRQTAQNLEKMDALFAVINDGLPPQVQCEISAYQISSALVASLSKKGNLSPADLESLKKSGKLLDRLLGTAKSGQMMEVAKHNKAGDSRFCSQPTIGTNGSTTDLQISYVLKIPSKKERPLELELKSQVQVEDGHAVIVQAATNPGNIAVVLRVNIVNSCGWTLNEAHGSTEH